MNILPAIAPNAQATHAREATPPDARLSRCSLLEAVDRLDSAAALPCGQRITLRVTLKAYWHELQKGIHPADKFYPVAKALIGEQTGQDPSTVAHHLADLQSLGLLDLVTRRDGTRLALQKDGSKRPVPNDMTYLRLPAGTITRTVAAARQLEKAPSTQREDAPARDERGQFKTYCEHCQAHGTLKKRVEVKVTVFCSACGVVYPEAEHQNGSHKPNPPVPQVTVPVSEAKKNPQVASENTGGTEPPNGQVSPVPQSTVPVSGRIAVLDVGALHVVKAGQIESYPANGGRPLAEMLDHAAAGGIEQLWLTPAWAQAQGLPASIDMHSHDHTFITAATDAGWDILPAGLARWLSARRNRDKGYDSVFVGFPAYDNATNLRTATDGRTLADCLAYFERVTGQRYLGHPLNTSSRILKVSNPGKPLEALDLPECAEDRLLEWELAWMSAPSLEETDGRHVHSYDRNGAYLAVCSSLTVGAGKLYHAPSVARVDARKPGYWLTRIEYQTEHAPGWLPDPFHNATHPAGEFHWRTSQTMALAVELGASIECREAWLWGQTQRPLERWYRRLKDARAALDNEALYPNREAAGLARGLVKACYTWMVGRLASHLAHTKDDEILYRPDIRHAMIAAARANMVRTMLKCAADGRAPILVNVDALYFLSDNPDPIASKPEPLEMSSQLGKWKLAGSWPAHNFCAAMWKKGATPARVVKAARDLEDENAKDRI